MVDHESMMSKSVFPDGSGAASASAACCRAAAYFSGVAVPNLLVEDEL